MWRRLWWLQGPACLTCKRLDNGTDGEGKGRAIERNEESRHSLYCQDNTCHTERGALLKAAVAAAVGGVGLGLGLRVGVVAVATPIPSMGGSDHTAHAPTGMRPLLVLTEPK